MRPLVTAALVAVLLAAAPPAHAASCDIGKPTFHLLESPTAEGAFVKPTGRVDMVLLFVDFPDAPAGDENPQTVYDALVPPAIEHFRQVSYGKLTLRAKPHLKWLRMPKKSGTYGFDDGAGLTTAEHVEYYRDALRIADRHVDFRGAELVDIVSSAGAKLHNSPALLAGPLGTELVADGQPIGYGATFGNDIRLGATPYEYAPWILEHETGHNFGLPDLYRFDDGDIHRDVGVWDPMGNLFRGTAFNAWHRRKLGWLAPSQITCLSRRRTSTTVALTPLDRAGGRKLLIVKVDRNRAYSVEVRRPTGTDDGLCAEGVIVSLVDARRETGKGPIVVQRAARSTSPDVTCGVTADAPFRPEPGRDVFRRGPVRVEVLGRSRDGYRVRASLALP